MSTLLTRLRSLTRSKHTSTPPIVSTETEFAQHEKRDAPALVEDASPDAPSHRINVELDSKIYPDLSALFASVEDALKSHERVAEAQKVEELCESTESENDYGDEQPKKEQSAENSTNDFAFFAPIGSGLDAAWSTFGQDDSPCPREPVQTHIRKKDMAIPATFRPSSADASTVLSWSPNPVESSESLRPTNISYPSLALFPSPEVQQSTLTSVYYSPSPRTFGQSSPPHLTPVDFPALPPPVFHSTPKTSSSRPRSLPRRSPRKPGRRRFTSVGVPRMPSTVIRVKRTNSDVPRISKRYTSLSAIEAFAREQFVPSRTSISVSRGPTRRKSAEWNARAASAGVAADPSQAAEFGWPAEVSREILRLSLGEHAMLHACEQDAPSPPVWTGDLRPEKAERRYLERGYPRVSHEYNDKPKLNGKLIGSSISENCLSSAHLCSTTLPLSSSTSSAPGRSDRQQTTATQEASVPLVSSVAGQKVTSQSSGDNAHDTKQDSEMGASGLPQHTRSESEIKIDWGSAELQEFISREESGQNLKLGGDDLRLPSTPMKKSGSDSTYQTAGSSSHLLAPSLSVIAPTPRSSPGASRHNSGVVLDMADGLQVPTPPSQTAKSMGKRKAEDSNGSSADAPLLPAKKADLADEEPRRDSNASHAPSSFQSFHSEKSNKRVRLSSPLATPDHSRPGSASPYHRGSVSSRGSSHPALSPAHPFQRIDSKGVLPRPASRISKAMSTAPSGTSSFAFPPRRSLSQASIPISAIITPRAPSVERLSSFHMRDPRKPPPPRDVGWSLRLSSSEDKGSPFVAWAFWFGFFLPLLWWFASFWRIPKTRMVGTDTEKAVLVDDPFYEREARTWRIRCRVASVVFFLTYAPVIILLAIFA